MRWEDSCRHNVSSKRNESSVPARCAVTWGLDSASHYPAAVLIILRISNRIWTDYLAKSGVNVTWQTLFRPLWSGICASSLFINPPKVEITLLCSACLGIGGFP